MNVTYQLSAAAPALGPLLRFSLSRPPRCRFRPRCSCCCPQRAGFDTTTPPNLKKFVPCAFLAPASRFPPARPLRCSPYHTESHGGDQERQSQNEMIWCKERRLSPGPPRRRIYAMCSKLYGGTIPNGLESWTEALSRTSSAIRLRSARASPAN